LPTTTAASHLLALLGVDAPHALYALVLVSVLACPTLVAVTIGRVAPPLEVAHKLHFIAYSAALFHQ
jgi:hypothetical protein